MKTNIQDNNESAGLYMSLTHVHMCETCSHCAFVCQIFSCN